MKTCNKCNETKEVVDFYKDKAKKDGYGHSCKVCTKQRVATYRVTNPVKIKARKAAYYRDNADTVKAAANAYHKANPGKARARASKRKAALLQRTPAWLTEEDHRKIEDYYILAEYMEIATGVPYHVDHIVPLQGNNVSGLHVPSNLQVITASENRSKSNKFK